MSGKSDYSKQQITKALIDLLQKQPIDDISITALTEKAKVSRNAFYNNFNGMEDVLKEVYREAHKEAFGTKFNKLDYFKSQTFIKDLIRFFDKNTLLLLALMKWNLLDYIAQYNTKLTNEYIKQCDDQIIKDNAEYFTVFLWGKYFNLCTLWILKGKQESYEDIYQIILYFNHFDTDKK